MGDPKKGGEGVSTITSAFHRAARVSRADLYGISPDQQLPAYLTTDARTPFLGFVGHKFTAGGVVLLAINPGGGGKAYQHRPPQDQEILPLIEAFVCSAATEASRCFRAMSNNYAKQVQTWNLWRILNPVLQACDKELSEIVFLNCFPYRTAGDRMPQVLALRASWVTIIEPLLAELKPNKVIALGKKAGGVAKRYFRGPGQLYVVPRTIGDTWLCPEAEDVLKSLREIAT
jgi:hypothetical protein